MARGAQSKEPSHDVQSAAQGLGKRGGLARAAKLSGERRTEIARDAALKRWRRNERARPE